MAHSLRILHCLRAPVGGLFRHVLDLAAAEAALGHEVGIVADSSTSDRLTGDRFAAIEPGLALGLHLMPMSRKPGLGDIAAARRTVTLARRLKVDVLHGHGAKGGAYARLAVAALKLTGHTTRCYYTPHGGSLHFDPSSLEGRVYLSLEKILARATDGLIFESSFSRRMYAERIGLGDVPSRVIPNGLQPADFAPVATRPDASEFLFVGELRHLKGVDVLLEALALLNRKRPVRATIVGDGPDRGAFEELSRRLGLDRAVVFTGALPAREAFTRGRVLLVPSRAESFPYIVLEAAAAGLPMIASSVGGIPEIVAGTSSVLVPPLDVPALASAMEAALADPSRASAAALDLKAAVAAKFTVDAMASAVLKFQARELPASEDALELTKT